VQFRRTSLTGLPAQSIRSYNAIALDSPYLLVLITRTSQSRHHVAVVICLCDMWYDPWLCDQMESFMCMSPPIRRKFQNSVAFATGCKKINKIRRGNRKIRVSIAMWPCKVEEKMTLKEVDGKTIQEFETKITAKDGTITRVPGIFQGYETSEEELVERPKERDLYEFVDHPQLQQMSHRNEFAPRRLSQPDGNMNGWLLEDEDEVERNEVDLDLESTASSKPVWEKTTEDDHDRASHHCPLCSK
ncbi:hypothetical protein Tco_0691341, partial [Tanacetum coccineum]